MMNIIIWGTGFAARELLENNVVNADILCFVDNSITTQKMEISGANKGTYKVISPEKLPDMHYDAVIVANNFAPEIYKQAISIGLDISKFIFLYKNYEVKDKNQNYELLKKVFSDEMAEVVQTRYHMIRGMMLDEIEQQKCLGRNRNTELYESDYVRIRNFELIANEINDRKVKGSVAELGVFQGEFAQYINASFPDKKCYLFDTFNGFRFDEAEAEKKNGNCGEAFIERFRNTTLESVIDRMPNKDNIVVMPGLFPESLNGLNDTFAFVSIDVDFEKAIYDGIDYFYPRMCEGGYIFIHDYNSSTLKGVKKAVKAYEDNHAISMAKMPICDLCGTLIIIK